ncbi:glycoside hydrolase family 13 protein [Microbacterium awajiense]|uniref:Glycoside hydrolase family 13 protein n=1 Tax=Microbacterium awajiense TaxID=415214 RepID=A0ABP7ARC9_9MICO
MTDREWWRTAVVYQIYVRSFSDSDGDGIGDLEGVRARLDHLAALGVDALWFTPWYPSPLLDGGYDISDHRAIDPRLGTLGDAEALIAEASERGIRTIIDVVPNHVSEQHPWFQEALASPPGSAARQRFWFRKGRGPGGELPPTEWVSQFGGETWTRVPDGEWYLHLFDASQPDLNWGHPDVWADFDQTLRFWFDRGVAGVRVDSAVLPMKDPALPEVGDHTPGSHPFEDREENHELYRHWRRIADEYEGRMLVGEVWLPTPERSVRYLRADEMHTAFNFDLMTQPWDASAMRASIDATRAAHDIVGAPATWVLSNHDVTRPVTRYGREESGFSFTTKRFGVPSDPVRGRRRARAAALLVAALPGSLYVYQGDELGLEEVDLPREAITDPMHFRTGGVDPGREGCRVPLPWSGDRPPYGFGPGRETWLPQPDGWADRTVEAQRADPGSMLSLYVAALRIRRRELVATDEFRWLSTGDRSVLAFSRGRITCLVNLGDEPAPLPPGSVVLASGSVEDGDLHPDDAVWLTTGL